jgi:hypothetical protein
MKMRKLIFYFSTNTYDIFANKSIEILIVKIKIVCLELNIVLDFILKYSLINTQEPSVFKQRYK